MKKILTILLAMLLVISLLHVVLADSGTGGIVTIDGNIPAGTLQARVEAVSGITGPTDVIELHVTATGEFNAADISYINSMTNLEVLDVATSVTVGNVGNDFLKSNSKIKSVVFPAAVFGDTSFHGCDSLKSVSLPNATDFGTYLFGFCDELTDIDMPSAQRFGAHAFYYCQGVKSITLQSAIEFGDNPFLRCTSLEFADLPNAETFGFQSFIYCSSLITLATPSATNFGHNTFRECTQSFNWILGDTPPSVSSFFSGIPVAGSKVKVSSSAISTYDDASSPSGDGLWYGWELVDNLAPNRISGVAATGTATVSLGTQYTLDLSTIFEDIDGDSLSYKVNIDGAGYVAAAESYSYTPSTAGDHSLVFIANDSTLDSTDTYTVTLTANKPPNRMSGVPETDTATIYTGLSYKLELTTVFEDEENDSLTHEVNIDGAGYVSASQSYTYTPAATGVYTLVFRAKDALAYSTDTYTVTLTAQDPPPISDSNNSGIVIIDGGVVAPGGLESRIEALSGIDGPTDVLELYVTAAGEFNTDDITYLNSMTNLKVLDVDTSISAGNVGNNFMRGKTKLTSAVFPATELGSAAFHSCSKLTSINLPNATDLGTYLFGFCDKLKNIDLPSAERFKQCSFYYCTALESITLPNALEFELESFVGCSSLESASLPKVTTFGNSAFYSCSSLTDVYTPCATSFGNHTFRGCTAPIIWKLGDTPPSVYGFYSGIPVAGSKVSVSASAISTYDNDSSPSGDNLWYGWELIVRNIAPNRKSGVSPTDTATVLPGSPYTLDLTTIFEDVDISDSLTYQVNIDGAGYVAASESYSYTPATAGDYTLVFKANDGTVDSTDTYTVTLTANTTPNRISGVSPTGTATVLPGSPYTLDLTTIFEDADSDSLTYKVNIDGAGYVAAAESYSYMPSSAGVYTLVFKANDSTVDSTDTYTVTLTANTTPNRISGVSPTGTATVLPGSPYTLDLTTIFEDADSDSLTYKVNIDGAGYVAAAESYSYTPSSAGVYTLVFKANDSTVDSTDTYTVTLTANTKPNRISGVSPTGTATVLPSSSYTLDLTTIFEDADSDSLTYKVKIDGAGYVTAAESYSYTPSSAGVYTLVFKANDGIVDSTDTYTVTLTANTTPNRISSVSPTGTATVLPGSPYTLNLSTIFEDADSDSLTYQVNIDGAGYVTAAESYSYTPSSAGVYALVFKANDGTVDSTDTYTVTLTANTTPNRISGVSPTGTATVLPGSPYTLDLTTIFEDADSNSLTYKVNIGGAGYVAAAESYSYTPSSAGVYTLVFKANDGTVDSTDTYTVTLTANTTPNRISSVLPTGSATVTLGTSYTLDLAAIFEDADSDSLTYKVNIDGAGYVTAAEVYSYSPISAGVYTLVFKSNDGTVDSTDTYTVTLTANTKPNRISSVLPTGSATVTLGTSYTLDLSTIFEDADSDSLTYKVNIDGAGYVAAAESYSYTPGSAGDYTLVFKANDGAVDSTDTYTVTLTANTKPNRISSVLPTGTATVTLGASYTLDLAVIFEDADSDSLTYQVNIDGAGYVAAAKSYSYTPGSAGDYTLVFKANDGAVDSTDTYTVTLTANTKPNRISGVPQSDAATVLPGSPYTLDLSTVFEDADSDSLTYEVNIDGAGYVGAAESYSYTPSSAGEYTLVFKVNDGAVDSTDTHTVTLTANTKPNRKSSVPQAGTATVTLGATYTIDLSTIFEDADSDNLTYQVNIDSAGYVAAAKSYSYTPSSAGDFTLVFKANDGTANSTDTHTVTLTVNTKPNRKPSVLPTGSATVTPGTPYTLDLSAIFEDADSDSLTYEVNIDGAGYVAANESYSYTPATTGEYTLVFKANDGTVDSANTYTVTLTVNTKPNRKPSVPQSGTSTVTSGTPYTLDLTTIFEDSDSDNLTYQVNINGTGYVAASASYSYKPGSAGDYTLVFRVNDGTINSTDTYTVTLTSTGIDNPETGIAPVILILIFTLSGVAIAAFGLLLLKRKGLI